MLNHFNFKRLMDGSFLVTNDAGQYEFLSASEFASLVLNRMDETSDTYQNLSRKGFVLSESDLLSNSITQMIRRIKRHVFLATSLHIFVVTNACNLRCSYCQAQASDNNGKGQMSVEIARKAVDLAMQSPNYNLTFEFQGGEPLLNFKAIREIIIYTEKVKANKQVSFTIVSNLSLLTDEILSFFIDHNVSISTSLDGPRYLHDMNRPHRLNLSSYHLLRNSLGMIQRRKYPVGAIETTTKTSLPFGREIVQEYKRLGFSSIFLRPLTPLGFAAEKWEEVGYRPEEFLEFYKTAFQEILAINMSGSPLVEQNAAIFLRKILRGEGINYMDLRSPCGAGIGQMAYFYDGNIYTCDEGRMIAEAGDFAFLLGNVNTHSYSDLILSDGCKSLCAASIVETLPGCCDCAYSPYCGVCPVINYARCGDIFPRGTYDYRCTVYSGILDYLFDILRDNDPVIVQILESWL